MKHLMMLCVMLLAIALPAAKAAVVVDNFPDDGTSITLSDRFVQATVDGQPAEVLTVITDFDHYKTPSKETPIVGEESGMMSFSTDAAATVVLDISGLKVESCKIRPQASGVKAAFKGQTVTMQVPAPSAKPRHFVLELNDDPMRVLHVFANPPEKPYPSGIFHVPPGKYSEESIAKLVADKKAVQFDPGRYTGNFLIVPEAGQTFLISGGCWMQGRFKVVNDNVTVRGRGVMHPAGSAFLVGGLKQMLRGFSLEGVTALDTGARSIRICATEDSTIDNYKNIAAHQGEDGICAEGSRRLVIRNCFVRVPEDCLLIKNGTDKSSDNFLMEDIVYRDCFIWPDFGWSGCEIGHKTKGIGIRNITFDNIDVLHSLGAAFGIHACENSPVENIRFTNIRVECPRLKYHYAARKKGPNYKEPEGFVCDIVTMFDNTEPPGPTAPIDGILIENVALLEAGDPKVTNQLAGYDEKSPVKHVTIRNFTWLGTKITEANHRQYFRIGKNVSGVKVE